ncbi:OmpP1/FadL family transporter [Pseudobacteriovorax antillogorgiicola]|uniref:Long-chain fatty acid transport protein n=1 Tax=Pseudobacteriovorax antillogorgiicola TaxID=1513793 RepID=A0A1Y6CTV5_9BACT|nr:outer membrane protein transport protein [Pseudobacteriovorax antillogorgiicola]TCS44991.1 long-subunit fatty acid transport protein [Pseudobacteriovorax antillogorgiicola]SMF76620.1 Long-chain fatty acid transport protein [Pseudobacteriovorax antillogorgiicola]
MYRITLMVSVASISLYLDQAKASVVDTYGISPRSVALGNAATAGGDRAYAAYANPASLTNQDGTSVSVGYQLTKLNLKDLNDSSTDDQSGLPRSSYRASQASPLTGTNFGLNLALSPAFHFGVAAYLPSDNFGQLSGSAPNELNYLRFANRQQRPAIYTAFAARWHSFSIGIGSYYTLRAKGSLDMALNNKASAARFNLDMVPVLTPYGGLQWRQETSSGFWSLGASYRAAQETESKIDTRLAVGATGDDSSLTIPVTLQTRLVPFYDPEIFKLGFALRNGSIGFYTSIEWSRWSGFEAPLVYLDGEDIASLTQTPPGSNLSLDDTWSYRFGFAYQLTSFSELALRLGIEHHESANQSTGQEKVVDLNRTVIAMGAGLKVFESSLPEGRSAYLDICAQHSFLDEERLTITGSKVGGSTDTFLGGGSL